MPRIQAALIANPDPGKVATAFVDIEAPFDELPGRPESLGPGSGTDRLDALQIPHAASTMAGKYGPTCFAARKAMVQARL